MTIDQPRKVFLYSHSSQIDKTRLVQEALGIEPIYNLEVDCFNTEADLLKIDLNQYQAVVLVYSDDLEEDKIFLSLLEKSAKSPNLERHFFIPEPYRKQTNPFPIPFHFIRYLQHKIYFYNDNLTEFKQLTQELQTGLSELALRQNLPAETLSLNNKISRWLKKGWQNTRLRGFVLTLPFFVVLLLLLIHWLPRLLTVMDADESMRSLVIAPEVKEIWLEENFDYLDNVNKWQQTHLFRGQNVALSGFFDNQLLLYSDQAIVDDLYQLKTLESWPIDDLQSLRVSYKMGIVQAPQGEGLLAVTIENAENSDLHATCQASAKTTGGSMQCYIQDIAKKAYLANEIPFTLEEPHDLNIVFVPSRYAFQFFVDGLFYGEIEIPSGEVWKDRNFDVTLTGQIANMDETPFSARFDHFILSHR